MRSSSALSGADRIAERLLQAEPGRLVVLEGDGATVRKTFTEGIPAERRARARAELSRLERFHAALGALPGATCPEPRGLVTGPEPGFRMSYVADPGLIEGLRDPALTHDELRAIGSVLASALLLYVEAVGEPYYDLKLDNVLRGPSGLTLLDFGEAVRPWQLDAAASPYEVSVANCVASAVFESARPQHVRERRLHRRSEVVVRALVEGLLGHGVPLRGDRLVGLANRDYAHHTYGRGRLAIRAWYATAGFAAGRRVRLPGGAVAGPVPVWRRPG